MDWADLAWDYLTKSARLFVKLYSSFILFALGYGYFTTPTNYVHISAMFGLYSCLFVASELAKALAIIGMILTGGRFKPAHVFGTAVVAWTVLFAFLLSTYCKYMHDAMALWLQQSFGY